MWKKIRTILIIATAAVLLFCGGKVAVVQHQYRVGKQIYQDASDRFTGPSSESAKEKPAKQTEPEAEPTVFKVEISVNDKMEKIYSLYNLDEVDIFVAELYDNYFIYMLYDCGRTFKQNYNVDAEGNVNLDGDPVEVFVSYLTAEERDELAAYLSFL